MLSSDRCAGLGRSFVLAVVALVAAMGASGPSMADPLITTTDDASRAIVAAYAEARPATAGEVEAFTSAVGEAIRRHPSLRASALGEQQAREAAREAQGALYPQIAVGLEGRHSLTADRATSAAGTNPAAVLTINQLLFDAGAAFDRVAAAQARAVAQRYSALDAAHEFALRAISTYHDVVRLASLVALAEDNLTSHEGILGRVRERTEGGVGNRADLVRARGRLADARSRLIDLRGEYDQVLAAYLEIFEQPPTHTALPALPLDLPDAEDALARMEASNPRLRGMAAEVEATDRDREAEVATRWPAVTFELAGRQYLREDDFQDRSDVSVMLRGSYRLFTGGADAARRQRALYRHAQAVEDERALRLELAREVRSALVEVATRTERLRALEFALQADRDTFATYLDLFTIGRRGLTDVLDAQRDLFATSVDLVNGRVALDLSRYVVLALTGDLLDRFDVREVSP